MKKLFPFYRGKSGGINFSKTGNKYDQQYLFFYILLIVLFFFILVLRLFQLTIVKGDYYRRLSEQNRIKELIIEAKRGTIFDRKGFVVAQNSTADIKSSEERLKSSRRYQSPEAIAHLVGYQQHADKNDLKNDNCLNKLKPDDKVGKKGIEKLFDCFLRGRAGKKLVEVNAGGKYLKTTTIVPPVDGENIKLAFDLKLQEKAYELVKDKKAAVVALKPQTGEVLIFVSSPSFNPQDFEDEKIDEINKYLKDEKKSLFNRITEGEYPPGSTFKPVVAMAALEEKKINASTIFEDTGTIKAGPLTFGNWYFLDYGKTEGDLDIIKAIKRSNDIFFYKAGEVVGAEKIKFWADKFGFGKITNIGLEESEGLIPSAFWKEEKLKERWYLGDTYNLSIGQGYLLTTPLQIAQMTAIIANNGTLCKPKLLKVEKNNNLLLKKYIETECNKLPLSKKNLDLIHEGMKQACAAGGTGWPFFDFKVEGKSIPVACKTGTAESHADSKIPHAWFTAYAPADPPAGGPEIAITVLLEEAGQGSDIAAPIAKEILKSYFERKE